MSHVLAATNPRWEWRPWHTWTDGATTWVDGELLDPAVMQLDIGCLGDTCRIPAAAAVMARESWDCGGVTAYRMAPDAPLALIVPTAALATGVIFEALRRFTQSSSNA